ncbi:hypothetical protein J6590_100696 [Homalodisca vitripennis]|nr:hypothetical protein J6590_100696 [Homalodisca vitripennis]
MSLSRLALRHHREFCCDIPCAWTGVNALTEQTFDIRILSRDLAYHTGGPTQICHLTLHFIKTTYEPIINLHLERLDPDRGTVFKWLPRRNLTLCSMKEQYNAQIACSSSRKLPRNRMFEDHL